MRQTILTFKRNFFFTFHASVRLTFPFQIINISFFFTRFFLLYFLIKDLDSDMLLCKIWFSFSKYFSLCTNILACFFVFNNYKSSLLGHPSIILIESLSQTLRPQFSGTFFIAVIKTRGLGSHLGNQTTVSALALIPIESSNSVKYTMNV